MTDTRPWRKFYDTARWKRMRTHQLTLEPLCRFCLEAEDVTAANVVDHITAHKGSEDLFFDPDNLQSLCAPCHDRIKREIERGKDVIRFDAAGWPI
ncbi:HNH endonuclease signature motif containing protein [Rhizobium sp. NFR03]|uniref:HNH endonuclease n=1 Tax=Rhizobium sp. NFR03 TaxID=1566263 RepID=UPI0008C3F8C5|nr:HNH endonuclease signature motif containing protein [Rhizobium sp. NFR03]SES05786.1 HNH endonuclease [Rhizobium sp. NFR03]